jgi:hypothetical protein
MSHSTYGSRIQSVPVAPLSCPRPVASASVASLCVVVEVVLLDVLDARIAVVAFGLQVIAILV